MFFSRDYGNQKGLYECSTGDERPRLLYPAKLSVLSKDKGRLSIIKKKFKKFMTTECLQRTLEGILAYKEKVKYTQEGTGNK